MDTAFAFSRPAAMIMGAGMLLPVLMAFLLECFFPRRNEAVEAPVCDD